MNYFNIILAIIGAHGLTDMVIGFFDPNMWLIYAIYSIIVFKSTNIFNKILFITHSISHFSEDIGFKNSIVVSTITPLTIIKFFNLTYGIYFQIIYLLLLHVPLHYYRKYDLLVKHSNKKRTAIILIGGHIIIYYIIKYRKLFTNKLENFEKKAIISIICSHVFYNDYYLKFLK